MQTTDAGHALLEQVGRMQARTAQIASEGALSENYETVLRTLATMLDNLDAATPPSEPESTTA
ncbi:hypothetical protein ACLQ3J_10740 [Rhodococcus sp. DT1]|uniref:hypothetical protein n=1 Tax=Rhodococcus sp. DT1 TaxID=3416544 RepID=UPI003CF793F2